MVEYKQQLLEAIRLAYLAGIRDQEDDAAQWCKQGSQERAEDLLEEFISDRVVDLSNDK